MTDTTVLLVAGGLHKINLRDGSGWSFSSITGDHEHFRGAGRFVANMAVFALTGVYWVPTQPDMIGDLVSNIHFYEESYLMATREHLVRIHNRGDVMWMQKFPDKTVGSSKLLSMGDSLIMINMGYGTRFGNKEYYGSPFIAAYDIANGKNLYLSDLPVAEKQFFNDYIIGQDSIFLVAANKILISNMTQLYIGQQKHIETR